MDKGVIRMDIQAIKNRYKHFKCAIDGKTYDVYEFTATESIFSDFRVDVTVVSKWQPNVGDYLDKEASLTLTGKKTSMVDRIFQGTITAVEECQKKGRFYLFKIIISPCLWRLTQYRDIRIFQNLTTPDIIEKVLKTSGILSSEYECRFRGKYSPREYCVQYRETNMDFITRLMAEEGMFFHYEMQKGTHFLVFGDAYSCHESVGENMKITIGKNFDESTGENKTVSVGKNLDETIGENAKINITKNSDLSIGENTTRDTGKSLTETIGKEHKMDVGDQSSISIGKDLSLMVGKKTVLTSQDEITFECGQSSIVMKRDGKIQIFGVDIKISASGKLVTKGEKISKN